MSDAGKQRAFYRDEWQRRLVASGLWARLAGSEQRVLSVLLAHVNDFTAESYPSVATIAGEGGTTRRAVQLALRSLHTKRGLIEPVSTGGGRRSTRYRLLPVNVPDTSSGIDRRNDCAPPAPSADAGGAMARASAAQRRAPQGRNGARPNTVYETPDEEHGGGARPAPAAPPGEDASLFDAAAAVELLAQRGFERADAVDLVRAFGVDRARDAVRHADFLQVKREIRKSYRRTVVAFLRGNWQVDERALAEERRAEQARRAAAAEQRKQADAERRRAELQAAEERDELLWSQLSPEQREDLHRAVLACMSPGDVRRRWPIDNPLIRAALLDELKRRRAS